MPNCLVMIVRRRSGASKRTTLSLMLDVLQENNNIIFGNSSSLVEMCRKEGPLCKTTPNDEKPLGNAHCGEYRQKPFYLQNSPKQQGDKICQTTTDWCSFGTLVAN